jgi:LSD1 subclass zinc finger protein
MSDDTLSSEAKQMGLDLARELTKYSDKMQDPRWAAKQQEVLQRSGYRCSCCGSDAYALHVTTVYYVRNRTPWLYPDGAYVARCPACEAFAVALADTLAPWESNI